MAVVQRLKPQPSPSADAENPRVAIGNNRPPLDVEARAAFDDTLKQRDGFMKRVADLLSAASRAHATDEESTGKCGELVKQIRAAIKVVEDAHQTTKAPYLAAGRAVDTAKNEFFAKLDDARKAVEAKQTQFLREESARREAEARRIHALEETRRREEVEKLAAEQAKNATGLTCQEASALSGATYIACGKPAERSIFLARDGRAFNMCPACAHHNVSNRGGVDAGEATPSNPPVVFDPAPAPAPEPERTFIRGDFGAAISGKKEWLSQVTDYEVAFMAVSNNDKVREAIDKAISSMVRGGVHQIEGVRIWQDVKVSNR
jgi:hypothetical protein